MKLKYPNTKVSPKAGDIVKFVEDDTPLKIVDVIDTEEKRKKWGVREDMIMMEGVKYGLISDPLHNDSEIIFVRRANSGDRCETN